MSASAPAEDRWRVIGKGNDATFRDCDDPSREEDEVRAARWIEHAAPESALSIERRGSSGFGDRVVTELTVCAHDAAAAEARARSLLAHALPAITLTEMIGRRDTVDRTLRYPADRVCSFCGKSQEQVRRLIAGHRGACICDECVGTAVETMDDAGPPPEPTSS